LSARRTASTESNGALRSSGVQRGRRARVDRQRGAEQHDEFVLREGKDAEEDEHHAPEQTERTERHHQDGDAVKL